MFEPQKSYAKPVERSHLQIFCEVPLTSLSLTNVADVAHTDKTQNHHCAVINGFLTFNDGLYLSILPHHMWTVLLHTFQNLTRPQTKC